jgi:hypothetical protein
VKAQVCDFSRSFYVWEVDAASKPSPTVSHKPPFTVNRVRVPLECLCTIAESDGTLQEYVLGAACKSERVNVPRDMWTEPNADFHPVASATRYLRIKSWDRCGKGVLRFPPSLGTQPERQTGPASEAFTVHRIEIRRRPARALRTTKEIIAAVNDGRPLVAQSEYDLEDGRRVTLEYPIKTINVSERDGYYQVDTGPVLVPTANGRVDDPIETLRLAYVAHNAPDWCEFIVNVPTPLTPGIAVNHYSRPLGVAASNTLLELTV